MPKISVIMSVFSESVEQLQNSIDSILSQSFQDFEFIIILDNPKNVQAETYISQRAEQDKRIIFLKNKKNIKLGASLNRWIAKATWKYIARMDADDICSLEKLEKQFLFLEKNISTDMLFTGWEEQDESWNREVRIPKKTDFTNIEKTFFYTSPLLHASMMCKSEILKKYKYPEIDRPEDFSLFLDLIYAGYSFDVLEENLYCFYVIRENTEKKYEKIKIFSSNYLQILSKNIPRFWKNIYFWWMFFVTIIQWILSRNRCIFFLFFEKLQAIYKKIFISNADK